MKERVLKIPHHSSLEWQVLRECAPVGPAGLTPISIKNNYFLKLTLLEQMPLLTCFGFCDKSTVACFKENQLKERIILNRCLS